MTVPLYQLTIAIYLIKIYFLSSKALHHSVALAAQQRHLTLTFRITVGGYKYATQIISAALPLSHQRF